MAKKYLEKLSELIKKVDPTKFRNIKLDIKHFFSGAAVYANGKIFMTLTPKGLAIKLPEELRNTFMKQKYAKPLRYFPNSPIKKEYVLLSKELTQDLTKMRYYVKISIAYVKK